MGLKDGNGWSVEKITITHDDNGKQKSDSPSSDKALQHKIQPAINKWRVTLTSLCIKTKNKDRSMRFFILSVLAAYTRALALGGRGRGPSRNFTPPL